jgi:hypothetical protein
MLLARLWINVYKYNLMRILKICLNPYPLPLSILRLPS